MRVSFRRSLARLLNYVLMYRRMPVLKNGSNFESCWEQTLARFLNRENKFENEDEAKLWNNTMQNIACILRVGFIIEEIDEDIEEVTLAESAKVQEVNPVKTQRAKAAPRPKPAPRVKAQRAKAQNTPSTLKVPKRRGNFLIVPRIKRTKPIAYKFEADPIWGDVADIV
jgi:hypothetical protein